MSQLNARLAADTLAVGETDFVWVRYMNDQRFPWLIVVPKQANLREWFELSLSDQQKLLQLVNELSQTLQSLTNANKMNLGAIGNLVPQLHIHLVARNEEDACWPVPVWGNGPAIPYPSDEPPLWLAAIQNKLNSFEC